MGGEFLQKLINDYGIQKLHNHTGISRSHLYGIQSGTIEPKVSTFVKIINCLGYQLDITPTNNDKFDLTNDDYFLWSLYHYQAPVLAKIKFQKAPDVNELLIVTLAKGRISPEVNTIAPMFIFKNWLKFDWDLILLRTDEKNYLGYLLNLVDHICNIPEIAEIYSKIYRQFKPENFSNLIKKENIGKYEKKRREQVDNMIARTWKFKTLDTLETIKERFEKWI